MQQAVNAGVPKSRTSPPAGSSGLHRRQQQTVAIIRVPRIWPGAQQAAVASAPSAFPGSDSILPADGDSLEAFGSELLPAPGGASIATFPSAAPPAESAAATPEAPAKAVHRVPVLTMMKWLAVVVLSAAAAAGGQWALQRRQAATATGTIALQTNPAGLDVTVDGRPSGVTPLTLTLSPAVYAVQIGSGPQRRDLRIEVAAGTAVVQHLEMPAPAAAATETGSLLVQTEPTGQMVSIDGVERGPSPLTIDALAGGEHTVTVRGPKGVMKRVVSVKPAETMSLLVTAPAAAPAALAAGWLSVQSPTRLELREGGKLIGTTDTEQIMLPAGKHEIEMVNESIGYRSMREVDVAPSKTSTVSVELPFGMVSLNAQPWAEVWIAGERIGDTPIANLRRRVGSYEVVFRHPQLGERRETILVTLRQPVRLGVDMRSK